MTISPLTSPLFTSQTANTPRSSSVTASSADSSASIGDQLLAALTQSQASNTTSSDPLLQELVSLSPAALGQTSTTPQTYNAQGLLQQIQNSMMLNDPLLQSDTTSASDPMNSSLLQSLMPSSQSSLATANAMSTATAALSTLQSTTNGSGTAGNAQSQVAASTTGSNTNWVQLIQQDPALASAMIQSQMDQGVLSMLG